MPGRRTSALGLNEADPTRPSVAHKIKATPEYCVISRQGPSRGVPCGFEQWRISSTVLKGEIFLNYFALANFLFHETTTYALLRQNGIELGKVDYLGALQ